jgi:hypothetical protein
MWYAHVEILELHTFQGNDRVTFVGSTVSSGLKTVQIYGGAHTSNYPTPSQLPGDDLRNADTEDGFKIVGTDQDDTIVVADTASGSAVGTIPSFGIVDIERLQVFAGGGNDHVENQTAVASLLAGGTGDDTLIAGSAGDVIFGGAGIDQLSGNAGNDYLFADHDCSEDGVVLNPPSVTDAGDRVYGGAGTDTIVYLGSDIISGGGGTPPDVILGSGGQLTVLDWLRAVFPPFSTDPGGSVETLAIHPALGQACALPFPAPPDPPALAVQDISAAPTSVELSAATDTGWSHSDDVTNLDNSAAGKTLQFAVTGTVLGATVTVYADGAAIGSAVAGGTNTTVTTNGTYDLADGARSITARQTEPGKPESADSPPLTITIDTSIPAADVVDVSPDPRAEAVASLNIVFSEPVYGFDLADLTLACNGSAVSLAGATLSTADKATWTLGNLAGLTGLVGGGTTNYVLTLTAAGSGITDAAGNSLSADASDAWALNPPTAFTGSAGDDTYEFVAAGAVGGLPTAHQLRVRLGGGPVTTYLYDAAAPVSLGINGGAGSDKITITGGPGTDTSVIYRYIVQHTGPGASGSPGYYCVVGTGMETIVDSAGAGTGQKVAFYDGPDNGDVFTASAYSWTASMRSAAGNPNVYSNSASGYDQIYGAGAGGGTGDAAYLYDSDGNDYFVSKAGFATAPHSYISRLSGGTKPAAYVYAGAGFEYVYGAATAGGLDQAVLYGSDGDDSMNFQPGSPGGPRGYITRPGGFFVYALNFKQITAYPQAGNDWAALYDTPGNDTFTASPTQAKFEGPAGSNIWNLAVGFRNMRAFSTMGGYDKAYLTGSTGDDTFTAIGMPRTSYPSGMGPGYAQLVGAGYSIQAATFDEVYANLLTGNKDAAVLYDSTGAGTDQFWGSLHDAVLSDGTLELANGNLLTAASYYFRVSGFDNAGLDPARDTVTLWGSPSGAGCQPAATGGPNKKHLVTPLDYVLATYPAGNWIDN